MTTVCDIILFLHKLSSSVQNVQKVPCLNTNIGMILYNGLLYTYRYDPV